MFRFLDYCNWSFERTSLAIAEAVVSRNVGLFRVHLRGDLCWPSGGRREVQPVLQEERSLSTVEELYFEARERASSKTSVDHILAPTSSTAVVSERPSVGHRPLDDSTCGNITRHRTPCSSVVGSPDPLAEARVRVLLRQHWKTAVQQSSCGGGSLSFRERSAGLVALVKADLAKTKDKIDLAKHLQQWEESTSTSSAAETSGRNLGGMNPPTNNFFPPGSRLVRGPPLPSRLLECYTIADVLFAKGLFPLVSDVFRYALASSHRHSTREVVQQPQPLLRTRTKRVPVSYMHAGLFVASLPELFKCCSHKQMGAALLVYVLRREELLKEAGVDGEVIFVNCERMSYSGDLAVVDLHFDFEDQPTKLNEILRAPLSRY